ncbi:ferredoxin [Phytoactinopolyspora endophytica]|uniref:ferredoxin n=1 Tax=Phytoactinopolyspora endophytica TaxID=1642495 RepID=UPI00101D58E5
MEIKAQRGRCIGSGMCVHAAPGLFDHDEDGRVQLVTERDSPVDIDAVREAVALCPSRALSLSEHRAPDEVRKRIDLIAG